MVGLRRATLPGLACEDCAGLDPAPRSLDHGLQRRRLLFHAPDDCFQGPHGFAVSGILALLSLVFGWRIWRRPCHTRNTPAIPTMSRPTPMASCPIAIHSVMFGATDQIDCAHQKDEPCSVRVGSGSYSQPERILDSCLHISSRNAPAP